MRKLWFIVMTLLALCVCQVSEARTDKTDKTDKPIQIVGHFGISGIPSVAGSYFTRSTSYSSSGYGTLTHIYADYNGIVNTTGTFIAGVDFKFNRVIAVSVDLGLNAMWMDNVSRVTGEKSGSTTGIAVYLFPKARIYYMDRSLIRLYGTVGLGVGKYFGYQGLKYSSGANYYDKSLKLEAELVPFGIEVGRKIFGFAEFGIGTIFMGAHVGIGYRF